jgi:hypothetical protein
MCRLDNPFIVFRGPEADTPATECTGSLVVMTSEPLQFKGVKIVLEGKRRTQYALRNARHCIASTDKLTDMSNRRQRRLAQRDQHF